MPLPVTVIGGGTAPRAGVAPWRPLATALFQEFVTADNAGRLPDGVAGLTGNVVWAAPKRLIVC